MPATTLDLRPGVMGRARSQRARWERGVLTTLLGVGAVINDRSFLLGIGDSVQTSGGNPAFPPTWWPANPTLEHWVGLADLRIGSFEIFFRNSLFVATTVTLLTLLTSSMAWSCLCQIPLSRARCPIRSNPEHVDDSVQYLHHPALFVDA